MPPAEPRSLGSIGLRPPHPATTPKATQARARSWGEAFMAMTTSKARTTASLLERAPRRGARSGVRAHRHQIPDVRSLAFGRHRRRKMGRQASVALCVLTLVTVVVSVDVLFFRNRFWERLMVNVGIVLVFVAFYSRFLKRP